MTERPRSGRERTEEDGLGGHGLEQLEIDRRGTFATASAGVLAQLGFERSDLLGKSALELVDTRDRDDVRALFERVADQRRPAQLRFRVSGDESGPRWVETTVRPFETADGELRFGVIGRDVTEHVEMEDLLQSQLEDARRIADLSREFLALGVDEIEPTIDKALASMAVVAAADRCIFVSLLPEKAGERSVFEWCGERARSLLPMLAPSHIERFPWCRVRLEAGEVVRVCRPDDLPAQAVNEAMAFRKIGLRSLLAIPSRSQGSLVGVLVLQSEREERHWTDHQLTFLRIASELFSSALRRRRNERALRESEERYRALAENPQDSICELAVDGRYVFVSPSYSELLGRERGELEGRSGLSFIHSDDQERVQRAFIRSLRGDSEGTLIYRASHRDGSWRHLEATPRAYETASGEVRVVGAVRDVSERERSKERLYRQLEIEGRIADFSRFFLDLEIDEIEDGIRTRLADLANIARAERAWLYFFPSRSGARPDSYEWCDQKASASPAFDLGFSPSSYPWASGFFARGEVIHVPSLDGLPPEAEPELRELERRGIRSMLGIPLAFGGQSLGCLGFETLSVESSWSQETITLLRLAGEIFLSALRRRRAEMELRASQQQLLQAQKMEAVGRLAGGIAHDFNNHLAVMLGNARFLRQELTQELEISDSLVDLERSAEHCSQLTRSLLAFSRRSPVRTQALDVRNLIAEVCELVGPLIPRSIELAAETATDVESVAADATQLQQVLVNLIVNACDAMPQGGRLELTAATRCVGADEALAMGLPLPGDYVDLQVRDTGVGMNEQTRVRIFEPFFTTKEIGKGTGLGLATVYGIVEQSRGVVSVDSRPGWGTAFHVLLPAEQEADAQRAPDVAETGASGCETLLLAEDEPAVRRLLARMLTSSGYRVLAACNGREALELADGHPGRIDALLSDVVMPGMGGFELAEQLTVTRPDIRVLFLSGNRAGRDGDAFEPPSGARWLEKPFREAELRDELRILLDASREGGGGNKGGNKGGGGGEGGDEGG